MGGDGGHALDNVAMQMNAFFKIILTSYDVEHSGVEDGRTDES